MIDTTRFQVASVIECPHCQQRVGVSNAQLTGCPRVTRRVFLRALELDHQLRKQQEANPKKWVGCWFRPAIFCKGDDAYEHEIDLGLVPFQCNCDPGRGCNFVRANPQYFREFSDGEGNRLPEGVERYNQHYHDCVDGS